MTEATAHRKSPVGASLSNTEDSALLRACSWRALVLVVLHRAAQSSNPMLVTTSGLSFHCDKDATNRSTNRAFQRQLEILSTVHWRS